MLGHVVWFPYIYRLRRGSRWFPFSLAGIWLLLRSVLLSLVTSLIELGHWGLAKPLNAWEQIKAFRQHSKLDDSLDSVWDEPSLKNLAKAGLIPERSPVARQLDQYLGDIFAYAESAMFLERTPASRGADAARQILQRLDETVRHALTQDGGCDALHILAHSLGSVISYHYLVGLDRNVAEQADSHLPTTVLHTIGSPLEKIRHFWRPLSEVSSEIPSRVCKLDWYNFANPFDAVSGRLRHHTHWGPVHNRSILEGGVLRSHTLYEQNRSFLGHLTQAMFDKSIRPRMSIWRSIKGLGLAFVESAGLLFSLVLFLAWGIFVFVTIFVVSLAACWLYAQLLRLVGWETLGAQIQYYLLWINVALTGVVVVVRKAVREPGEANAEFRRIFG